MSLSDTFEDIGKRAYRAAATNNKLAFVTTALKDYKTGDWVNPNIFQRELLSVQGKNTVLRIHRRGGKCVDADESITLTSGQRVRAGDLIGKDFKVNSIFSGKKVVSHASAQDNGVEQTLRLTTESGRSVVRSLEHPFYTPSGWKEISKIIPGDEVAVPSFVELNIQSTQYSQHTIEDIAQKSVGEINRKAFHCDRDDLGTFLEIFFQNACNNNDWCDILSCEQGFRSDSRRLILDLQELLLRLSFSTKITQDNASWILRKDNTPYYTDKAPIGLRWERVVSVFSEGLRPTVAVQVPGPHNFLTSFYEHNTYGMILIALYECLTRKRGQILFVAPRMAQVEMFFDELDKFIEANAWIKNSLKTSSKRPFKKTFSNGTVIKGFTLGSSGKGSGTSLRGQTADVILLDEIAFMNAADFAAIQPIIEGDVYRPVETRAFAASTPAAAAGMFHTWCTDKSKGWHEIFMPVTENPDWPEEKKKAVQQRCSQREWQVEWLCDFMDTGASVFGRSLLINAQRPYKFLDPRVESSRMPIPLKLGPGLKPKKQVWRTMGVDWDKYNRDGAGPQIAVLELDKRDPDSPYYDKPRLIYRQSLPQGKYSLTDAVERIITLNRLLRPDLIYVDRGGAESNVELLHKRGEADPTSRLHRIVKGIAFNGLIECPDPTDQTITKKFKPFMVNLLNYWLEQGQLLVPSGDKELFEQFINYQIKSINLDGTAKYNQDHEHIIDAVGLAAVALWKLHKSPFERRVGTKIISMAAPQRVAKEDLTPEEADRQHPVIKAVLRIGMEKSKPGIDLSGTIQYHKERVSAATSEERSGGSKELREQFRQTFNKGFGRFGDRGSMKSPMRSPSSRSFRH